MASLTDGGVGVKVVFLLMMQEVLAEEATCYSAGSVAGAVVGTLLVTLALVGLAYLVWRMYWRSRRGKHLVLVTDPEGATDQYAFDNPCFKDGTPIGRTTLEKEPTKLDQKARWSPWNALVGTRTTDKRRALDDSFIGEPQVNVVALRSHDFTGLGFNICGNMRDGIFVKDVLHRGPASESGRITPGDRIDSIRISFRHMVFEDALTILSYASPYDVQLEVENASNSRPSTLIRTKRTSGSSIAPADRICHPFYRSQSIADLAQIGKASLKRMQQMGGIGKSPRGESHLDESGDYPTLKLSSTSSGNDGKKDNVKLEKTAPTSAIIKPERAKRVPSKSTPSPTATEHREFPNHEEEPDKDTVNRFQKFGVRVLPDPNVSHRNSHHTDDITGTKQNKNGEFGVEHGTKRTPVEAEHRQNEHNSIIEKVGEGATAVVPSNNPHSGQRSSMPVTTSEVDGAGGKPRSSSFYYDERGIDVGPVELQKSNPKQSSAGHYTDEGKQLGDVPGESNVKNLLTKGLQNLKDKLHHHEKKKNGSQNSELFGTTDQDVQDITPHLPEVIETEISRKNGKQREDKPEVWQDSHNETLPENSQEGGIPTEIPEEVHRAALAARSNRKSTGNLVMEIQTTHERKRTVSQEGPNGGSSSEGEESTTTGNMDNDSLGRTPKRPNKRKAPPPPEESDEKSTLASQSPHLESDRDSEEGNLSSLSDKQRLKDNTTQQSHKKQSNPTTDIENIQTVEERVEISPTSRNITSFADLARQRNNNDFIHKEITNITIEGNPNKPLRTDLTTFGVSVAGNANMEGSLGIDKNITQDTKPQQQHLDYDIGVNVSSINSDSDSDLERLEGDDDSYDGIVKGRKTKKGGTTIELNSSHITIHHSPSSETVPIENESTRKAASLGDLSRLDSEQPMSILERAVSLDMADGGGTPHGCKKRKAPPPPPGEDYLGSMPDGDEGIAHRKEPRLDSAMDTFQRRRLKKSSDWGTLEEALMQTDAKASADLQGVKTPEHVGEEIPQLEGTVTVFKRNSSEQLSKPDEKNEVDNAAVSATFTHHGITRTDILNLDNTEYSALERGVNEIESINQMENDSPQHQQKTILRITPEPVAEPTFTTNSSQVTIASSTFGNIPGHLDNSAPGERVNPPRHQAEQSQIFTTKLGSAYGLGQSRINNPPSPQHSGSSSLIGLVSSTPISHSGEVYSMTAQNGNESVQSPIVTSSHAGISSVHVVSSTTHDITDPDSNVLASSITDQFVTAVDSTTSTLAEVLKGEDDEDANWGHDSQPPELPTSPVPVMSHLSSFKPSPSMTYITEIQVVTTADSSSNDPVVESTVEEQETSTEITNRPLKYKSDSSMSSDSITSEGDNKDADTAHEVVLPNNAAQKGNVTVTSIRNTVSRIPMRIATDRLQSALPSVHIASNSINHVINTEERRVKPARPPVPPRKSESSVLSTVTTDGVSSASRVHNRIPAAESIHIGSEPSSSSSKFISFSSLTPQITSTENGASRNSTSFEQWVFLDEGSPHNGLEAVSNANDSTTMPHSMVVSLPARTQSVTHIVLDTKQSNGNNGKP